MSDFRVRVGLGVEPFVLRSALHACLERDPRLDVLLPANGEAADDTVGSAMIPAQRPDSEATVAAVLDCPPRVELSVAGRSKILPYGGMAALAETLVTELSATTSNAYDGGSR